MVFSFRNLKEKAKTLGVPDDRILDFVKCADLDPTLWDPESKSFKEFMDPPPSAEEVDVEFNQEMMELSRRQDPCWGLGAFE